MIRRGFGNCCDDVRMPVICPTCQHAVRVLGLDFGKANLRPGIAASKTKTRGQLSGAGFMIFAMMPTCT
jgi:hypothetical protein